VDGAVVVAPFASLVVATEENADKPAMSASRDDLSQRSRQRTLLKTWHTAGTLPPVPMFFIQLLRGGDG